MLLSTNLSRIMGERGITQTELAKECGVTQIYIGYIVNGHQMPSVRVLMKISDYLGISMDELCKGKI